MNSQAVVNPIRVYFWAMEALLSVLTVVAAFTAGWAAAGPGAGLLTWTVGLVLIELGERT